VERGYMKSIKHRIKKLDKKLKAGKISKKKAKKVAYSLMCDVKMEIVAEQIDLWRADVQDSVETIDTLKGYFSVPEILERD
jgi:hypothetical protein